MSSYELLELLEFMPEEGALKYAMRGGEYTENEQVWRHVATEMSKLRSITIQAHGGKPENIRTFPTVTELREQAESIIRTEERREDFFAFADRTPNPERMNADDDEDF